MASPSVAANAYASLAKIIDPAGGGAKSPSSALGGAAEGPSFGALLKETLGNVADAGRKSDAQAVAMASGKANVVDVVTAVSETQVAVETMVSVRDRVIQAYEDIMKMQI